MEQKEPVLPCYNEAAEIMQPVRLRYKIGNQREMVARIATLKCLEKKEPAALLFWTSAHEVLQMKHGMSLPPFAETSVLLGNIELRATEVLVIVNSIERAAFAILFFDKHFGSKVISVETMDVCNKLYKNSEKNSLRYSVIESFFENKTFEDSNTVQEFVDTILNGSKKDKPREKNRKQLAAIVQNEKKPIFENKKVTFYSKDGIESVKYTLKLAQTLALRHLQGETQLTMFDLMSEMRQAAYEKSPHSKY
ncbi:MAG: hypothetical protein RI894_630 [Bacteroidota bacterium]|jgi:hypothetical protein